MYQMEKNTAVKFAATREAMTWKSRVHAGTWHVRSRFDSSWLEVLVTSPTDDGLKQCPVYQSEASAAFR
jgi:hypothetical protein